MFRNTLLLVAFATVVTVACSQQNHQDAKTTASAATDSGAVNSGQRIALNSLAGPIQLNPYRHWLAR